MNLGTGIKTSYLRFPCKNMSLNRYHTIFSIKKEWCQKQYKYVRVEKSLNMNKYILDFKQLPTSLVYAFDVLGDKISVLNKLVNQCISKHAHIKQTKFTCPPAPWLSF